MSNINNHKLKYYLKCFIYNLNKFCRKIWEKVEEDADVGAGLISPRGLGHSSSSDDGRAGEWNGASGSNHSSSNIELAKFNLEPKEE